MNIDLRLSAQRALLGNVTANLAVVTVKIEDGSLIFCSYFFKAPTEDDIESLGCASGEIAGDFPADMILKETFTTIESFDMRDSANCVFMRAEVLS